MGELEKQIEDAKISEGEHKEHEEAQEVYTLHQLMAPMNMLSFEDDQ